MSASALGGVFISYSSVDRQIVSAAARLLRAAGATVFQDITDLQFGEKWDQALLKAIAQCERVLVFWSAAAAQSAGVEREWRYALDAGKRIVPMSLDKTPLPPPLAELHGVPDLVEMLRSAMQLAAAAPSTPTAATPGSEATWRIVGITGASTAALVAALGYGWLSRGSRSVDFDRGTGVPEPPSWTQALPLAAWVGLLAILSALVVATIVWRARLAARRRQASLSDAALKQRPTDAMSEDEADGAWATLGARFAAALLEEADGH